MSRARLARFLKARSPLVALLTVVPLVVAILGLTACVKHPVGDPEKSKVDPKLSGVWGCLSDSTESTLWIIRPYDSRTYLVKWLAYTGSRDAMQPKNQVDCKAWLTTIGGATFLTLQPLDWAAFAGLAEPKSLHFVMKTDLASGALRLRIVHGDQGPARDASNSRELEEAIAKNVGADSLYTGEPTVFKKVDDKALIQSLFNAYRLRNPLES